MKQRKLEVETKKNKLLAILQEVEYVGSLGYSAFTMARIDSYSAKCLRLLGYTVCQKKNKYGKVTSIRWD